MLDYEPVSSHQAQAFVSDKLTVLQPESEVSFVTSPLKRKHPLRTGRAVSSSRGHRGRGPGHPGRCDPLWQLVPVETRVGTPEMEVLRNHPPLQYQYRLDQSRLACSRLRKADIGFRLTKSYSLQSQDGKSSLSLLHFLVKQHRSRGGQLELQADACREVVQHRPGQETGAYPHHQSHQGNRCR